MAKAQSPADDLETDAALAALFRRQIRFWTITAVVIAVLLYVFSDILLPFVAGMVLAYFLDPVADRLQRIGLSRVMATVLILFAFIVVLTLGAGDRRSRSWSRSFPISSASCRNI